MLEIISDEEIPIERNFKVSAGPGAGKTHWLITHVKNVLRNSKRLAKTAKIACITFTNTGVEEIRTRLGNVAERVEITTIHSFLYRNILKPYGFLLKDSEGRYLINMKKLDGHDEHIPSKYQVSLWIRETRQTYLNDDSKIFDCLADLDWHFDDQGQLELRPRQAWKSRVGSYSIRKGSFLSYKELYWKKGLIHHEDVLYFAYRLIMENPRILHFLRAKFPYVFVDEFQDTHPIQTAIITKIAETSTIGGVIGDTAQSIYSFQGASRLDFINFNLPGMKHYVIKGNRRSTRTIIDFLNIIRDDIEQISLRDEQGNNVKLIIGNSLDAIKLALKETGDIIVLARDNTTISKLKTNIGGITDDLWRLSRILDQNYERQELIYSTLFASGLIKVGNFYDARKKIERLFKTRSDGILISRENKRDYSIRLLKYLIERYQDHLALSITDYNNKLFEFGKREFDLKLGAKITRGNYKENFGDKFNCKALVNSLRFQRSSEGIMTIHQAKGAEFGSVLLVLTKPEDIERITKADLDGKDDESRIYYVALSRAENYIYISVPIINQENIELIKAMNVDIWDLLGR